MLISGSYDSCNIFPSFFFILSDITFGCELVVLVALILRIHGRAITTTAAAAVFCRRQRPKVDTGWW